MTVSINDKLRKYKSLFSTTLSTGIGTGTGDTITPASVSGLPTDTPITLTFDRVDSGGVATPTKLERIRGIVSGGNFISYVRGKDGTTEQAHSAGAVIEMIWNADDLNDMVDWGVVEHNQDGTHKSALVTTLKATASEVATGTNDTKIVTPLSAAAYGNSSMARQAIINGNFDVWQRGTSVAWGDSVYTADRWMFNYGAVIAGTVTRQDGTGVYGSRYCTRVQRTAGASTVEINFTHSIESNDSIKFRGKKVTLSFYARKGANYSAASDYLVAKINTGTGTDEKADRYTGTATVGTTNAVLTTSWQKYTVTTTNVLADTVTELGIVFDTIFTGTAGAADYFEITQVQLCAGDVALPFQPKSFNQELIDCERYCQSFIGITNGVLGYGNAASATAGYISIPLKRAMFGTVGVTLTASDWKAGRLGDALVDVTSLGMLANYQGNNNLILELGVASGLPAGESIVLVADGTTRTLLVTSEL